ELEVPLENPEIHRPAVARGPVVGIAFRPTQVMEADGGPVPLALQYKSDARSVPVGIGPRHLELELGARHHVTHLPAWRRAPARPGARRRSCSSRRRPTSPGTAP